MYLHVDSFPNSTNIKKVIFFPYVLSQCYLTYGGSIAGHLSNCMELQTMQLFKNLYHLHNQSVYLNYVPFKTEIFLKHCENI
jgi:hypothetical protein